LQCVRRFPLKSMTCECLYAQSQEFVPEVGGCKGPAGGLEESTISWLPIMAPFAPIFFSPFYVPEIHDMQMWATVCLCTVSRFKGFGLWDAHRWLVKHVISQNADGLHRKSGIAHCLTELYGVTPSTAFRSIWDESFGSRIIWVLPQFFFMYCFAKCLDLGLHAYYRANNRAPLRYFGPEFFLRALDFAYFVEKCKKHCIFRAVVSGN